MGQLLGLKTKPELDALDRTLSKIDVVAKERVVPGRQGVLYSEGGAGARSAAEASAADAAALSEIAAYNKTIREAPVGKVDLNRNRPMPGNIPYQPKNHYRVVGKEGLADLETSGVVRARQGTKAGYEYAYFNEGSALGRYWGDVVIEVAPTPKMRRAANGYQVADNVNPITKADAIRIWVRTAGTAHYDIAFDNINDVVSRQFRSASGAERGASATVYRGEYARPHDTELPAFKTWFRESAVVDSKGLPLRVYHGTPVGNIEAFDKAASSSRNVLGHGFYFTEDPLIAAQYTTARRSGGEPALADGGAVIPVYLSIQRPLDMGEPLSAAGVAGILAAARRVEGVDVAGLTAALEKAGPVSGGVVWAEIRKATSGGNDAQKAAANAVVRGAGFDGLRSGNTWVIFEPNQAKSAVGNRGTFSLTDDRILYSRSGEPRVLNNEFDFDPEDARQARAAFERLGRPPTLAEIITRRNVDEVLEHLREQNPELGPERADHVRRKVSSALAELGALEDEVARAFDDIWKGGTPSEAQWQVLATTRARAKAAHDALRVLLENESRKAKATPPFVSTRTGTDAVRARLSAAERFEGVRAADARDAQRMLEMLGHPLEGGAFKLKKTLNRADTVVGTYNFTDDVLSLAQRAFDSGMSARVLAHEIGHRVSAWLPKDKAAALLRQYVKERRVAMKASPEWFDANGKMIADDNAAYRWSSVDEWFAERFADHAHKRLGQWDASTRSVMDAARFLLEKVKARIVEFFGVDAVPGVVEDLMAGKVDRVVADARAPLRDRLIEVTDVSGHGNAARPGPLYSRAATAGAGEGEEAAAAAAWRALKTESPWFKRWFGGSKIVDAEGKPLVVYHGTAYTGEDGQGIQVFRPPKGSHAGVHFGTAEAASDKLAQDAADWASRGRGIPSTFFTDDAAEAAVNAGWRRWSELQEEWNVLHRNLDDLRMEAYRAGGDFNSAVLPPEDAARVARISAEREAIDAAHAALIAEGRVIKARLGENVSPVYLSIRNPIEMKDTNWASADRIKADNPTLGLQGKSPEGIIKELKKRGYDGIEYVNTYEDVGSKSYIAFSPEQIKSATANRGTFSDDPRFLYSRAAPAPSAVPKPSLPEPTDEVRRAHQALAVKRLLSPSAETRAAHQAYQAEHPEVLAWAEYRAAVADAELAQAREAARAEYEAGAPARQAAADAKAARYADAKATGKKLPPEERATNRREWFGDSAVTTTGEAGGKPLVVTHESPSKFSEFRAGEFGFHFGVGIPDGMFGSNRVSGLLRINNPMRMADLGVWTPERVLAEGGFSTAEQPRLLAEVERIRAEADAPTKAMVAKARASGDVATAEKWQALLEDGSDAATFRDRRGNYLASRPVHDALREKGYDGIVYRNEAEGVDDSYIAFEPQQFKSNKNVGTYDATDPRFLYSRAAPARAAEYRGVDGKPRTATMFSGGGLVEAGLRKYIDPVFAVEANPEIGAAYKAAHGGHVRIDDVRNVDLGEAGDVDYLHASPVCKNFSAAKAVTESGEQPLDLETARATADAIRRTQPAVFTLENVRGYRGTKAMRLVEDALREGGYTFDANVYDAADYGAATRRKRLLLRAVKDGELPPAPAPTHGPGRAQPYADWYGTVADLVDDLPDATPVPGWARERLEARGIDVDHIEKPLLVMGGSAGSTTVPHASAGGAAPTIKATPGELHRIVLPDGRVKRVTPRAAARITGLPDDYPLPTKTATATTIIGNGVPPALSEAVFAPLLAGERVPGSAPARLYSRAPGNQTDTPAFRAFIEGTKVVDESGAPRRLYHGTTHDFEAFDVGSGNVENHHGRGIYLTSASEDVGANYATREGPDLKSRIESQMESLLDVWDDPSVAQDFVERWLEAHPERAAEGERLVQVLDDGGNPDAKLVQEITRWVAEQEIAGSHGGAVLPVYAAIKNPVDLRPGKVTRFDIETKWSEDGEDFLGETGAGVEAIDAIRRMANSSDTADLIIEALGDISEGFDAADLERAVRDNSIEFLDDDSSAGQFLQDVYRELGFDGIVIDAYKTFGPRRAGWGRNIPGMAGLTPGTEHWVAFEPTQVKSATGNRGTFDPKDKRLLYSRAPDGAGPTWTAEAPPPGAKVPGIVDNPAHAAWSKTKRDLAKEVADLEDAELVAWWAHYGPSPDAPPPKDFAEAQAYWTEHGDNPAEFPEPSPELSAKLQALDEANAAPEPSRTTAGLVNDPARVIVRYFKTANMQALLEQNAQVIRMLLGEKWAGDLMRFFDHEVDAASGQVRLTKKGEEQFNVALARVLRGDLAPRGRVRAYFEELRDALSDIWLNLRGKPMSLPPGFRQWWDATLDPAKHLRARVRVSDERLGRQPLEVNVTVKANDPDAPPPPDPTRLGRELADVTDVIYREDFKRANALHEYWNLPLTPGQKRHALGILGSDTDVDAVEAVAKAIALLGTTQARRRWGFSGKVVRVGRRSQVSEDRKESVLKRAREALHGAIGGDVVAAPDGGVTLTPEQAKGLAAHLDHLVDAGWGEQLPDELISPQKDLTKLTEQEWSDIANTTVDDVAGPGSYRDRQADRVVGNAAESLLGRAVDALSTVPIFNGVRRKLTEAFDTTFAGSKNINPAVAEVVDGWRREFSDVASQIARLREHVRAGTADETAEVLIRKIAKELPAVGPDPKVVDDLVVLNRALNPGPNEAAPTVQTFLDNKAALRALFDATPAHGPAGIVEADALPRLLRLDATSDIKDPVIAAAIEVIQTGIRRRYEAVRDTGLRIEQRMSGRADLGVATGDPNLPINAYKLWYAGKYQELAAQAQRRGQTTDPGKSGASGSSSDAAGLVFDPVSGALAVVTGLLADGVLASAAADMMRLGLPVHTDSVNFGGRNFDQWVPLGSTSMSRAKYRALVQEYMNAILSFQGSQSKQFNEAREFVGTEMLPVQVSGLNDGKFDPSAWADAHRILDSWGIKSNTSGMETMVLPTGEEVFMPKIIKDELTGLFDRTAKAGLPWTKSAEGEPDKILGRFGEFVDGRLYPNNNLQYKGKGSLADNVNIAVRTMVNIPGRTLAMARVGVTTGVGIPNPAFYIGNVFGGLLQAVQSKGAVGTARMLGRYLPGVGGDAGKVLRSVFCRVWGDSQGYFKPASGSFIADNGAVISDDFITKTVVKYGLHTSQPRAESAIRIIDDLRNHEGTFWTRVKRDRIFDVPLLGTAESAVRTGVSTTFRYWQGILGDAATAVDDLFRVATYVDELAGGVAPAEAAAVARRTSFDYADLTDFEKEHLRRFIMFYTFQRRNADLFWWTMLNHPSRIMGQVRAVRDAQEHFLGEDDSESILPEHLDGRLIIGMRKTLGDEAALRGSLGTMTVAPPLPAMDHLGLWVSIFRSLNSDEPRGGREIISRLAPEYQAPFVLGLEVDIFSGRDLAAFNTVPSWMVEMDRQISGGAMVDDLFKVRKTENSDPSRDEAPGVDRWEPTGEGAKWWWVFRNLVQVPPFGRGTDTITQMARADWIVGDVVNGARWYRATQGPVGAIRDNLTDPFFRSVVRPMMDALPHVDPSAVQVYEPPAIVEDLNIERAGYTPGLEAAQLFGVKSVIVPTRAIADDANEVDRRRRISTAASEERKRDPYR